MGIFRLYESVAWSTFRLPRGERLDGNLFCFFRGYVGSQGQGFPILGDAETSLREGSRLSGSTAMDVRAVTWEVWGGTREDRVALTHNAAWKWEFGGGSMIIDIAPASAIDPQALEQLDRFVGGEPDETRRAELRAQVFGALFSTPDVERGCLFYRDTLVAIPPGAFFGVLLRCGNDAPCPTDTMFVRFMLHGSYKQAFAIG